MPPLAYLLAKCVTAMAFGVIIVTLLTRHRASASAASKSRSSNSLRMIGLTIVGSIPFACMGLLLALLVPFNAAPGIANMIYLPMSFLGGLWIPIEVLPHRHSRSSPPSCPPTTSRSSCSASSTTPRCRHAPAATGSASLGFTALMLGIAAITFNRREQNA